MKLFLNLWILVFQVLGLCSENIDYSCPSIKRCCKGGWKGEDCCTSGAFVVSLGAVIGIIISIILLIILIVLYKCRKRIRSRCCPPLIQKAPPQDPKPKPKPKPNPKPKPKPKPKPQSQRQEQQPKPKPKRKRIVAQPEENSVEHLQQQTQYIMTNQTLRVNIDDERILRIQRRQIFRVTRND